MFLHLAEDEPERALEKAKATLKRVPTDRFTSPHFHHFNAYTNALLYSGDAWKAWHYVVESWPQIRSAGFPSLACIGAHLREIRARVAIAAATTDRPAPAEDASDETSNNRLEITRDSLLAIASEEARQIERRSLPHTPALAAVLLALPVRKEVAKP